MVRFVTFYIKPSPDERATLQNGYQKVRKKEYLFSPNPDKVITLLFASVKRFHPKAKLTLITDEKSEFALHPSIEIFRYERKSDELDVEMLHALIGYLEVSRGSEELIYLEWDQLVQGALDDIFKRKGDLYFAVRNIHPAPIDDAFIAISAGENYREKIKFFETIIDQYDILKLKEFRYWLGKSLILSMMIFEPMVRVSLRARLITGLRFNQLKIETLDGKIYSRKLRKEELDKFVDSALVLHFPNEKRSKMGEYWHHYLAKK